MNRSLPYRVVMYAKYITPRYSGAGRQAVALAAELRRQEPERDILLITERPRGQPERDRVEGIEVRRLFPETHDTGIHPRYCLAVLRELLRSGPAVFHAHSAFPEASAMGVAARLAGSPSVLKVTLQRCDVACTQSRLQGPVHRRLLRAQSAIVAMSDEIRAELTELGIPAARIQAIPNGVDTRRFRPADPEARLRARQRFDLPATGLVLVFVGGLNSRKNVAWLLEQWLSWASRPAGATLLLVGPDDGATPVLRRLLERASQAGAARWAGRIEDIEQAYAAADLLVLPSQAEGMPNVALEAMACGLPVALSDASGSRQILGVQPAGGVIFSLDDPAELYRLLRIAANEPARLREWGAEARSRVVEAFSLESVARRYRLLYSELMERSPAWRFASRTGAAVGRSGAVGG